MVVVKTLHENQERIVEAFPATFSWLRPVVTFRGARAWLAFVAQTMRYDNNTMRYKTAQYNTYNARRYNADKKKTMLWVYDMVNYKETSVLV